MDYEENIEMGDIDREVPEKTPEEGETSFIEPDINDDPLLEQRPNPNRRIQIIDSSTSKNIRESFRGLGRAIEAKKRRYTKDKKDF